MKRLGLLALFLIGSGLLLAALAQQTSPTPIREYPTPAVREEQTIIVGGRREIWQLRWATIPEPNCEPDGVSFTCPCTGFAYGEAGDLTLLRLRDGIEVDRLHVTPFFAQPPGATIQRWQPRDEDLTDSEREDFPALVSKRPSVQVMHFADYDRDGWSNEFYLQTESAPCGKSVGIVIGLSRSNPRLHVFGTAANPRNPLYMQKRAWDALRKASGPLEVEDWACGDHGAPTETTIRLRWTPKGIDGTRREYTCPFGTKRPRRLIHEKPL